VRGTEIKSKSEKLKSARRGGLEISRLGLDAKICATHQGCGRAEVRIFASLLQDGSDLVLREVASFDVSTDHCGHEASFVLQLGGHGPLV
jgi:hypothetical protein